MKEISKRIAASSLGTAQAKAARESVPRTRSTRVLARAAEIREKGPKPRDTK